MTDIVSLLADHSRKDSIDALYYALRAIKQAAFLHVTGKDIFQDDARSAPSIAARELTAKLVSTIEADAGKAAADFDRSAVLEAIDRLTSASRALDGDYTQAEIEAADQAIRLIMQAGDLRTRDTGTLVFRK